MNVRSCETEVIKKSATNGGGVLITLGDVCQNIDALKDASVDIIIADPPYSRSSELFKSTSQKYAQSGAKSANTPAYQGDNKQQLANVLWHFEWMNRCADKLKDGGVMFVFTDYQELAVVPIAASMANFIPTGSQALYDEDVRHILWLKANGRPKRGGVFSSVEHVLMFSKGRSRFRDSYLKGHLAVKAGTLHNNQRTGRCHVNEKPLEGLMTLIEFARASQEDVHVLDPFMGSGAAGIAALYLGCRYTGIEKNEHFYNKAKERIDHFLETGEDYALSAYLRSCK